MAQRQERLRDPKSLVFGTDSKALDAQMAEKQSKTLASKEQERLESNECSSDLIILNFNFYSKLGLRIQEIDRILEESEMEEKRMREFQRQQLKEDWDMRRQDNVSRNMKSKDQFDHDSCGPSSAQSFIGEDLDRLNRVKAQQNQMKTEPEISSEHITNNQAVRKTLLERGIRPESLPPAEDVKKVERRLASDEKKSLKNPDILDN